MKISPLIADWNENDQNASVCSGGIWANVYDRLSTHSDSELKF